MALDKLDDLKEFPRNPRDISEDSLAALKTSLSRFGDIAGITWNKRSGYIVSGHQRIRSLRDEHGNGLTLEGDEIVTPKGDRFPVRVVDWDANMEKAANIAANNPLLAGEFSTPLDELLAELRVDAPDLIDGLRVDELLESLGLDDTPEIVEDEVPEVPADPVTKLGDVWVLGDHRLVCGDSMDADLPAIDCVFTSPPYAVGIDYGDTYTDTIDELRRMIPLMAEQWASAVVPGGFAVVNFGDIVPGSKIANADEPCQYPAALEYFDPFRAAGWFLWSERIWAKPHARVAAPWCASSNRAASDWEHIWTWKTPGKPIVGRVKNPPSYLGVCDTAKLEGVEVGKSDHGAGMPVGIASWMIATHTHKGGQVFEPFAGTGTSIVAAEQLERRCFGVEISPAYCDVIVERWENLTGGNATRG